MTSRTTDQTDSQVQLGRSLRSARDEAGLTQDEQAAIGGVSHGMVEGYERGTRPLSVHRVPGFGDAAILGTVRWLLSEMKEPAYRLAPCPSDTLDIGELSTLLLVQRESADVVTAMLEAQADGALSEAELDRLEREIEQDIAVKQRALEGLRQRRAMMRQDKREIAGIARCALGPLALRKSAV